MTTIRGNLGYLGAMMLAGCGGPSPATCDADAAVAAIDADAPLVSAFFLDRDAVDFGDSCEGHVGAPIDLIVANAGATSATVVASLTGEDASSFVIVGTSCEPDLAARSACVVSVAASPGGSATARVTAVLEIAIDGATLRVPLSAQVAICDGGHVEPTPHNFGDLAVGERSAPMTFTARNLGEELSEPITEVRLSGLDEAQFEIVRDACEGHALLPGFGCEVDVVYAPSAAGVHMGALSFTGFDIGSAVLLGRAAAP